MDRRLVSHATPHPESMLYHSCQNSPATLDSAQTSYGFSSKSLTPAASNIWLVPMLCV
jgi:hypothetical protein